MTDVHSDDLQDLLPVVDDGRLGSSNKQIKDEAFRRTSRPILVVFLHLSDQRLKFDREEVRRLVQANILSQQLQSAIDEGSLALKLRT